jgi:hypothetical protein
VASLPFTFSSFIFEFCFSFTNFIYQSLNRKQKNLIQKKKGKDKNEKKEED